MRSFFISVAAVALMPAAANATILTFDVSGGVSDFEAMHQSYGDDVAGSPQSGHTYGVGVEGFTPNVVVDYGTPGEHPALWTTGYGSLTNVYFNDSDGDTTMTTRFTAGAGYLVDLYSFDLASFLSGGQTIQGLSIRDVGANTVLYSQGATAVSGSTFTPVSFSTPLSANTLEIVIDLTGLGGVSDDIGMDNIRFGQRQAPVTTPIPEPATWAMMILGFFGSGSVLRKARGRLAAAG